MNLLEMLPIRRAEREVLLMRAREALENDPRVCAAWLFGSLARGDGDDLSDLDLFVVVEDAYLEALCERQAHVAPLGTPLLFLEAPQNAPPAGAYLMVLYEGQAGPHQVDWYWQAHSAASIPQETVVLLDRAGLPRGERPTEFSYQPVPEVPTVEAISRSVNAFWAGLLITAKYVARSPWEERMALVAWPQNALTEVQGFAGLAPCPPDDTPHRSPTEKLVLLRALAGRMEALMPQVAARGARVPAAIVPHAHRYLAFVEALCVETSAR